MAGVAYPESRSVRSPFTAVHPKYTLPFSPARQVPSQSSAGWLVKMPLVVRASGTLVPFTIPTIRGGQGSHPRTIQETACLVFSECVVVDTGQSLHIYGRVHGQPPRFADVHFTSKPAKL